MRFVFLLLIVLAALALLELAFTAEPKADTKPVWEEGAIVKCDGLTVSLSRPRLVARRSGFLWFPTFHHFGDKHLMAVMSNYADEAREFPTALVTYSEDGGLTWSVPEEGAYSECAITLGNGDTILLPYYLQFQSETMLVGPYQWLRRGEKKWKIEATGVEVTGWPRKVGRLPNELGNPKPEWKLGSFVFNGQGVRSKDGKNHLATLYGRFVGDKRYSLVIAESTDARTWKVRSVIADATCKLKGGEGPCESALVRLKDERLLCVYRLDSGVPYGHSFSDDDGKTWSEPKAMDGPQSVQPSLAVSPNGILALSGGRPGLKLWLNKKGDASQWGSIDLAAHHNAFVKDEPITKAEVLFDSNTSAYTEVRWLDAQHFLVMYDRLANGWKAIPSDSKLTNSVWVVRGKVE
ncbi:MAG: sialidase family protein [Gemmataceae bacterium]|nr:sialidase family protein [Gemmataceae bacterium]